jgi:hypothetical protein
MPASAAAIDLPSQTARIRALEEAGHWAEVLAAITDVVDAMPDDTAWMTAACNALASYHIITLPLLQNPAEPVRVDLAPFPTGRPAYEHLASTSLRLAKLIAGQLMRRPDAGDEALVACGRVFELCGDAVACGELTDRLRLLSRVSSALAHFRARLLLVAQRDDEAAALIDEDAARMGKSGAELGASETRVLDIFLRDRSPESTLVAPCALYYHGQRWSKPFAVPNAEIDCDQLLHAEVLGRFMMPVDVHGVAHVDGIVAEPENVFGMASLEQGNWERLGAMVHVVAWRPDRVVLRVPHAQTQRLDEALLAGTGYGENYFHWMFEVLPRLAVLDQLSAGHQMPILLRAPLRPWQEETLAMLGVSRDRVVLLHDAESVQVDVLWVPRTAMRGGLVHPYATEFLRSRLARPRRAHRRIYCPRGQGMRRLLNDTSVAQVVTARGYETFSPAGMSVSEQMTMFSEAAVIVGPTGAALTNAVFAPAGSQLVVFNARAFVAPTYVSQAVTCNQAPHVVIGDERETLMMQRHWDYAVDVADVESALDAAEHAVVND